MVLVEVVVLFEEVAEEEEEEGVVCGVVAVVAGLGVASVGVV